MKSVESLFLVTIQICGMLSLTVQYMSIWTKIQLALLMYLKVHLFLELFLRFFFHLNIFLFYSYYVIFFFVFYFLFIYTFISIQVDIYVYSVYCLYFCKGLFYLFIFIWVINRKLQNKWCKLKDKFRFCYDASLHRTMVAIFFLPWSNPLSFA